MHQPTRGAEGSVVAHAVAVGALCGLLAIVQSVSYGSLLFPVGGGSFATIAIGMALFSSAVIAAITPLISSTRSVISITQGVPVVALTSVVGPIANQIAPAPEATRVATIVVATALSTLLIGVASLGLGSFKLGRFIRFAPFPVVGGFLAGSGWLMLHGGLELIAGPEAMRNPLRAFADPGLLPKIGLAAVLIAALVVLGRASRWRLAVPVIVVAGIIVFNIAVRAAGVPTGSLHDAGWLLQLPEKNVLWPPIAPAEFGVVDWRAMLAGVLNLPSVAVLTVLAVLMNATGIELQARRDADLDRELSAVGYANIVAAVGGGLPGYHTVSLTLLATRLGARGITVGLTVAAVCFAGLIFGSTLLSVVPIPLLGAMLIWIGAELVGEWLLQSYFRLPLREYLVVVLIFCVIVLTGFAWGLLVGLAAAIVLFVVEYGRVDIVRYFMSGQDYQTSNDASEERLAALRQFGDAILIVRLQGFLFFGTADRLRKRIHLRITEHARNRVRFVVIDFRRVTGLDSSTVLSFIRLAQTADADGFVLVLTGMSSMVKATMLRAGLPNGAGSAVRIEPTFDVGLEWSENELLGTVAPESTTSGMSLSERLASMLGSHDAAETMLRQLTRVDVADGDALISQGAPSDEIYFIEAGRAAVEVRIDRSAGAAPGNEARSSTENADHIRLAAVGPGAIVGEIAFYLDKIRSASIVAEGPLVAWRLSRSAIDEFALVDAPAVARFHEAMAGMLAARLANTNELIRLLAD